MKKYIFLNFMFLISSYFLTMCFLTMYCMEPSMEPSNEENSQDSSCDIREMLRSGPPPAALSSERKVKTWSTLPELPEPEQAASDSPLVHLENRRVLSWQELPGLGALARRRKTALIFEKVKGGDVAYFEKWLAESNDVNVRSSKTKNTVFIEICQQLVQASNQYNAQCAMLAMLIRHAIENNVDFAAENKLGENILTVLRSSQNPLLQDLANDFEKALNLGSR